MRFLPITVLALSALLTAQKHEAEAKTPGKTVVQLAIEAGSFDTLVTAVKAAGLVDTLSGKGPFTIFAPTDEAFAALGEETIATLLKPENKQKLTDILMFHVVAGNMPAGKVVASKELTSLLGQSLTVMADKKGVAVGGAKVLTTDIMGSNGVIHVIDRVLMPKELVDIVATAKAAGQFKTLLTAAVAAGLADTLATKGPFTVFAPTDEAFAELGKETIASLLQPENKEQLANILKLHVVSGVVKSDVAVTLDAAPTLLGQKLAIEYHKKTKVLTVGGATVIAADVMASNGVIHVIDTVLLPKQ